MPILLTICQPHHLTLERTIFLIIQETQGRRMKQKEACAKTSTGTKPPYTEILKASFGSKDRLTT